MSFGSRVSPSILVFISIGSMVFLFVVLVVCYIRLCLV